MAKPELIAAPGSDGAGVADLAGVYLLFEFGDGEADDLHVSLFVVAFVQAGGEFFGDEDVLALARETGEEAGLCAQLAARELFGIVAFGFPSTLRQLERALADGVAVLFDEPDVIAVDGKDGGAVILVDDAIDAASAVRAFDLVFAKAEPRILGV